jgi:hypothetical protein
MTAGVLAVFGGVVAMAEFASSKDATGHVIGGGLKDYRLLDGWVIANNFYLSNYMYMNSNSDR